MQKQAKQFIELLVSQQLLAPEIVEELNRQVAESKNKLSPELLAKLLVDNGHLTKFQATKLVAEIRDAQPATEDARAETDDDLGFAPDASGASESAEGDSPGTAAIFVDDDEPLDVDAADVVDVVTEVEVEVASEVIDVVEVVDEMGGGDSDAPRMPRKVVKPEAPKTNPYDSFRILGIGLALAMVTILGVVLVYFFTRGNAEALLKTSKEAYEQQSYETAADGYAKFAKNFTTHEQVSFARVRHALARLRKDVESVPDPAAGLKTALEVLPPIKGEAGLNDQKGDLTGALIALASKFNDRADKQETIEDRKVLMGEMDKLLQLINNPQFVGKEQQDQQAPTLNRIFEDRKRIMREIGRDEELEAAVAEIDQKLASEDVLAAYAIRKKLVRKYPLVATDEALKARVNQATDLLRTLVQPSVINAKSVESPLQPESGRQFVLANRTGSTIPELENQVLCVRVKGSVYGFAGDTGAVLWRQFVGRDFASFPVRLDSQPGADVLISDTEKGLVSRLNARTGEILWTVDFGTPIRVPTVESDGLFVTTFDGSIISLDAVGGQTKWATKLPQGIPVGVAAAFNRSSLYVAAEHSNLYVLSRSDGSCKQVVYLETGEGAIAVPPVLFQGQLFVFDNKTSSTANIRMFDTDEAGLVTAESQLPMLIEGNVVVSPQIDRRRLIVQSDVGAMIVLDVEPTADTRRVSNIASITSGSNTPFASWAVAENNRIWTADKRLTRLDLRVTQQKVDRTWATNEGDSFTGPISKFGDVIVHTRRLRGNRGVRVSAVKAANGDPIWSVDVAVPVTVVAKAPSGGFDVINSSGMYFDFDGRKRIVDSADSNPGAGKPETQFSDPVELAGGKTIMLNRSRANHLAVFSASDSRLRVLTANLGNASPSCQPVAVGANVGIGLDKGQFVLLNPNNGRRVGSPFQPSLEAGRDVVWNTPVYWEDSKTLIVSSSLLRLSRLSADGDLRLLNEVDLETRLISPLGKLGSAVCGVVSTGDTDSVVVFDAKSLQAATPVKLPGRYTSGPFAVPGGCVVQTKGSLVMFSEEGAITWTTPIPDSKLISAPISTGGKLVLATGAGQLFVIDAASGQVTGSLDARQAFTSAPIVVGEGRLLIGSDEGAVLALPLPSTTMEVQ